MGRPGLLLGIGLGLAALLLREPGAAGRSGGSGRGGRGRPGGRLGPHPTCRRWGSSRGGAPHWAFPPRSPPRGVRWLSSPCPFPTHSQGTPSCTPIAQDTRRVPGAGPWHAGEAELVPGRLPTGCGFAPRSARHSAPRSPSSHSRPRPPRLPAGRSGVPGDSPPTQLWVILRLTGSAGRHRQSGRAGGQGSSHSAGPFCRRHHSLPRQLPREGKGREGKRQSDSYLQTERCLWQDQRTQELP